KGAREKLKRVEVADPCSIALLTWMPDAQQSSCAFGILYANFGHSNEAIRAPTREGFAVAIRPSDFDATHVGAASEPEVKSHIIIRDIAGAAAHLLYTFVTFNNNRDPCADAISIGPSSFCDHA